MDWDDLRVVLAIARAGSLSGAARQLGVNQTTAGRRLTALERRLGAVLFSRSRTGFHLTEAGEAALSHMEIMETAAMMLSETVGAKTTGPSGLVRIASMPWIFNYILIPALPAFSMRYPGIELHGIAAVRERSLSNREAELALRFEMPPRGRERSYEIATVPYAVYGPRKAKNKMLPWIGSAIDSGQYEPEKWLNAMAERRSEPVCFRSNDAGLVHQAICAGAGKGLLPEVLAENNPALVRLSGPKSEIVRRLRVLVHPDVERFARVRVTIGWLRETLAAACSPNLYVADGYVGNAKRASTKGARDSNG